MIFDIFKKKNNERIIIIIQNYMNIIFVRIHNQNLKMFYVIYSNFKKERMINIYF